MPNLFENVPVIDDQSSWPMGSRGLIPRDYRRQPLGSLPYAAPLDIPLIPRNEWADRIREKEKAGATLRELCRSAGLNPPDQNGTNYCHDDQTEVLTEKGWTRWSDYNWRDFLATVNRESGLLEYQLPLQQHIYEYSGPMHYAETSQLNFGVTPDHFLLSRSWDEQQQEFDSHLQFIPIRNQLTPAVLPHAPWQSKGTHVHQLEIHGSGCYQGDDFVMLLALSCSENGHVDPDRPEISVEFADGHPLAGVWRQLLLRLGFESLPEEPRRWVRRNDPALAKWLCHQIYFSTCQTSRSKRVPELIRHLSVQQIHLFLSCLEPQQSLPEWKLFSRHSRLLDDVQELLLKIGRRSVLTYPHERQHELHSGFGMLRVEPSAHLILDPQKDVSVEHYSGPVYCASVPNRTLITRRKGKILISGNCWANGPTHALEICRLIQGQKLVRLSPASVAAPLTGYRNVGGWGAKALDYIVKQGVCPVSLWPANAINRKYDTEASRAERQHYRITHWYDVVTTQQMSARERFDRLATMLLLGYPCSAAYNWWGHLVCAVDLVLLSDGKFGVFCHNSGAGRDAHGFTVLSESRGAPDECLAPHIALASAK